jgi:hypothetical protein
LDTEHTPLGAGDGSGTERTHDFHPIQTSLETYVARLRGLHSHHPKLVASIEQAGRASRPRFTQLFKAEPESAQLIPSNAEPEAHAMPLSKQTNYLLAKRSRDDSRHAARAIPRATFLAFVSYYDAFIADLIRAVYQTRRELQNQITREVSFSELTALRDIDALKALVIDKEIETFLRENRATQFKWLEKRFSFDTSSLETIEDFFEIAERRNLVAHNDGRITSRYLEVTKSDLPLGDELPITADYIEHAFNVLFETGVTLAQTIWRKVSPTETDSQDKSLEILGYDMLVHGEYYLASRVFSYGAHLAKHSSQRHQNLFVVNLAQSHRWMGDSARCEEILSAHDWSAASQPFLLAVQVLRENWTEAAAIMDRIVGANELPQAAFTDWPLFQDFRDREEFVTLYVNHFGEPAPTSESPEFEDVVESE